VRGERVDDKPPLQIDYYGIKISARPTGSNEPEPETWLDVVHGVNRELKSLTIGIFRLLSGTVRSATNLVRGLGEIPNAISSRVSRSHTAADQLEAQRALQQITGSATPAESIRALLARKQTEGYTVRVASDGDRTVLLFLPPADDVVVDGIADATLANASRIAVADGATSPDQEQTHVGLMKRVLDRLRSSLGGRTDAD